MCTSQKTRYLLDIFMMVNTAPHCCWGFLAVIVGTPVQKVTKRPKWWMMNHDPSGVKRKRVAKDFSAFVTQDAEEVIRLMEDEEVSAWCNKNFSDDS